MGEQLKKGFSLGLRSFELHLKCLFEDVGGDDAIRLLDEISRISPNRRRELVKTLRGFAQRIADAEEKASLKVKKNLVAVGKDVGKGSHGGSCRDNAARSEIEDFEEELYSALEEDLKQEEAGEKSIEEPKITLSQIKKRAENSSPVDLTAYRNKKRSDHYV